MKLIETAGSERIIIILLIIYWVYSLIKKFRKPAPAGPASGQSDKQPEGDIFRKFEKMVLGDEFVTKPQHPDPEYYKDNESVSGREGLQSKGAENEMFLTVESELYKGGEYGEGGLLSGPAPNEVAEDCETIHPLMVDFDPRKALIWAEIVKRPYC